MTLDGDSVVEPHGSAADLDDAAEMICQSLGNATEGSPRAVNDE